MITTTDFAKHLSRFLSEYLPHERNVSPNTIASYRDALAAIHSFCWYLHYAVIDMMEQWQKILTIKAMRTEGTTLNYLSAEGVKLLLAQPDTTTRNGRRHLAILSLMYETGARVQEMADLTVDSVRISHEPYTIRLYGKGRKARIVPLLAKEQVEILRGYMEEYHLDESGKGASPLFFNNRHEKLTREGISYILATYANLARKVSPDLIPERISCHSDLLGHVSIQTTDIYARADSKAKREALEKAYADLLPNRDSDREWEKSKDLRDWLRDLGH